MADQGNKKNNPNFLNEKGDIDFSKILAANPNLLASYIHKREDDDDEGSGSGDGTQATSMTYAKAMAASRDAMGLSMSYVPLNSADQVREMSLSAQANLGLEPSQGLSIGLGSGNASNPFGGAEDKPTENKNTEAYRKKIKGL